MRYIIFGAGGVGCAVGGFLARAGRRAVLVARGERAAALARGLTIRTGGEEITVAPSVAESELGLAPEPGDVIFLTTKSQDTAEAVRRLSSVYGADAPLVCLQNGVRNEEVAARHFRRVYAGLAMFGAVQFEPGSVEMPRGRTVVLGLYPEGVDDAAREISSDLLAAGFESDTSAFVMRMKWGKLVNNLNNATVAITDYWLERVMADREMREFILEVCEEGLRVLDAAGIAAEPPEEVPSPIRVRRDLESFARLPDAPAEAALALPLRARTYASMWQDLYHGRKSSEAAFLNGEIVGLGARFGIPTPYNSTLLEVVNRMVAEGHRPGFKTLRELKGFVNARRGEGVV